MKRLKKSAFYQWLVHLRPNNRVMDAFMDSTVSSGNNDKGFKELCCSSKSVICGKSLMSLLSSFDSDSNEQTQLKKDGVANESLPVKEVTSVPPVEPTNEMLFMKGVTKLPPVETTSETSSLYELLSVPHDGSFHENTTLPHFTEMTTEEENIHENMLEHLSKIDDGDEYVDFHTFHGKIRKILTSVASSITFRIFGILLVFVDMSLVITDLIITESKFYIPLEYRSVSLAIALFFVMDVLLRIYVEGTRHYFSNLLNILDAIIIVVILLVDVVYIFYDAKFLREIPRLTVLFRPLRLIILGRVFQLAYQKRHLEKLTRRLVSGNKRRYKKDGFDLDLTYVTDRIIAMSFPSSGKRSFYRNPISEVVRFLETKHPDHYQVYNLCSERAYDPKHFHYRVRRIKIDDHNVPTLEEMLLFSKEVEEWMAKDPENIIVIHCKGGKGRTGTMICACLIASEVFLTAKDSLSYFGDRRTENSNRKFQGVETPSQNRYVKYFEKLKIFYNCSLPPRKVLTIKRFIICSIHGVGKGDGSDLKVQIIMQHNIVFSCSSCKNCTIFHDIEIDKAIINLVNCPELYDDVKVKFLSKALPAYYDDCPFFFWFHTSFIQYNRLYLPRHELDNLHKPKTWKIYPTEFAVEVQFDEISQSSTATSTQLSRVSLVGQKDAVGSP